MRVIDCVQGSHDWKMARLGKVTASRVADVVAKTKAGKWTAKRNDYLLELVCERLTGEEQDRFVTWDMQWGLDNEDAGAELYGFTRDVEPQKVGLVLHPTIDRALASPDRLIGDDGLIEVKCPKSTTHVDYMMNETVPPEYMMQIYWQLVCTGREWCDFVSYDPRMPGNAQLSVQRVTASSVERNGIEQDIRNFLEEVAMMEEAIANRVGA